MIDKQGAIEELVQAEINYARSQYNLVEAAKKEGRSFEAFISDCEKMSIEYKNEPLCEHKIGAFKLLWEVPGLRL